jgi:glutathione S-transferase
MFLPFTSDCVGIPYVEKSRNDPGAAARFCWYGENKTGMPISSPPVISRAGFTLCQTPAILAYLGQKYGMAPTNMEDFARANMINLYCADVVAEGRLQFHPVDHSASYYNQIEEAKPYVAKFERERVPEILAEFEMYLNYNGGGQGFVIGQELSFADIALFHSLCAFESQFPQTFAALENIPLCKAYKERIAARPRIAVCICACLG